MMIKEEKAQFRERVLRMLKAQAAVERAEKSELIRNKVLGLPSVKWMKTIMVYVSDSYEVETYALIQKLLEDGKHVIVPQLDTTRSIIPCRITDLEKDTYMTRFGYREPHLDSAEAVTVDTIETVLVPGVAFDSQNNRLGRGWGCYDRFLAEVSRDTATIGLAFDFQVFPQIPLSEHDVPLSAVLTN